MHKLVFLKVYKLQKTQNLNVRYFKTQSGEVLKLYGGHTSSSSICLCVIPPKLYIVLEIFVCVKENGEESKVL